MDYVIIACEGSRVTTKEESAAGAGHGNLAGSQHVRILREALKAGHRLFPRTRDRMEVRRHLLKLRYWPERWPRDESGMVLDLDWEKVRALA